MPCRVELYQGGHAAEDPQEYRSRTEAADAVRENIVAFRPVTGDCPL